MHWPGKEVGDGLLSFVIVLDSQQLEMQSTSQVRLIVQPPLLVLCGVWNDVDLGTRG